MTAPRVTIVTTVYDRLGCLDRCLRATAHSDYQDFEQVVVSDAPGEETCAEIDRLVQRAGARVRHLRSPQRANDWGMTPAWLGVRAAAGEFVCFLSDDNAYLPSHLPPLVGLLDADARLGFVYSAALYDGRLTLTSATPIGGRIDLGQPLFRAETLRQTFPGGLPFNEMAWDWRMIHGVMETGARWMYHPALTFVFRFAKYPVWMRALA